MIISKMNTNKMNFKKNVYLSDIKLGKYKDIYDLFRGKMCFCCFGCFCLGECFALFCFFL